MNGVPAILSAAPGAARGERADAQTEYVPLDLPGGRERVWAPAAQVEPLQALVGYIQENTAPGEPIFAYPAIPGVYYLADRPNATRHNHLFKGMASPEEQNAMVDELARVQYVIWDDGGAHYWVRPGDNALVTEHIRAHFRVERAFGIYIVLTKNPSGAELPYALP